MNFPADPKVLVSSYVSNTLFAPLAHQVSVAYHWYDTNKQSSCYQEDRATPAKHTFEFETLAASREVIKQTWRRQAAAECLALFQTTSV